jgi:hypothetical protein
MYESGWTSMLISGNTTFTYDQRDIGWFIFNFGQ